MYQFDESPYLFDDIYVKNIRLITNDVRNVLQKDSIFGIRVLVSGNGKFIT